MISRMNELLISHASLSVWTVIAVGIALEMAAISISRRESVSKMAKLNMVFLTMFGLTGSAFHMSHIYAAQNNIMALLETASIHYSQDPVYAAKIGIKKKEIDPKSPLYQARTISVHLDNSGKLLEAVVRETVLN